MVTTALKGRDVIFVNLPRAPNPAHWGKLCRNFVSMPINQLCAQHADRLSAAGFRAAVLGTAIAYSLTKVPWKGAKYALPDHSCHHDDSVAGHPNSMFATWAAFGSCQHLLCR